jgi:1-acyl-sn-glycerol-3-phosphate acyltransferase
MITYQIVKTLLMAYLKLLFSVRISGEQNIPVTGPAIVACNHISYLDPICHGYLVVRRGRWPRFFAKAELWKNPALRFILTRAKQIAVERGSGEMGPVESAIANISEGNVVMIYPEATITTNPDLTPMPGKTGVARVAVATGAPIIPVAVWGSHWAHPKNRKPVRKFRRTILVKAGEPIRLTEAERAKRDDPETLRDITDRVIGELDRLVRELHKVYPEGAAVPELRES